MKPIGRQRTWSPRLFVADLDEPRARRAGDLATIVIGFLGLILVAAVSIPPSSLEQTLSGIIAAIPDAMHGFWRVLAELLGLWAAFLVVASLWRRRWTVLRDMVVAVTIAFALVSLMVWLVTGEFDLSWRRPDPYDPGEWVAWVRLFWPVTVTTVTAPHVVRPARTVSLWVIGAGITGAILGRFVAPTVGTASLLVGLLAAAATLYLFGSPKGRPDVATVRAALAELGVEVTELSPTPDERRGVFVLDAVSSEGTPLIVKVYGRDAYDTQLVNTIWNRVWFRDSGTPLSAGRLVQVGQEAYLTLLVEQKGIPTHRVVTAGQASNGDALLVLERVGTAVKEWSPTLMADLLRTVADLHESRITHGEVDSDHVILVDGRPGLASYRGARVTTNVWRFQSDLVQAFVSGVLALGLAEAVRVAVAGMSPDAIERMLPYLQPDTLTTAQRKELKASGSDVDDIREALADAIGVEAPELVRLRRVTIGSILKTLLPFLAFFALASIFAGLDVDLLLDTMADASWWLIIVGLLIGQIPRFSQTMSAIGATPIPIPASRMYLLQLAQSYIALSVPGGAARIALNTRFFQRHGLSTSTALTVGAIDSFTGFLSQMLLLAIILTTTSATLDLDLGEATSLGLVRLLLIIIGLAVAAGLVVVAIPKFRRPMVTAVRSFLSEAGETVRGALTPKRVGLLIGGGVITEVVSAMALGVFVLALGHSVGLPELILIIVIVGVAAGVLPVPGGIGVIEGGIIFGLARAGVPEEAAFAAAILYRAATYYLPPIWGVFAFRHLERNKHL